MVDRGTKVRGFSVVDVVVVVAAGMVLSVGFIASVVLGLPLTFVWALASMTVTFGGMALVVGAAGQPPTRGWTHHWSHYVGLGLGLVGLVITGLSLAFP